MMDQNYLLTEMSKWQKECLDFLVKDGMSIQEKINVRISILSSNHKDLGYKVKEIRRLKSEDNK